MSVKVGTFSSFKSLDCLNSYQLAFTLYLIPFLSAAYFQRLWSGVVVSERIYITAWCVELLRHQDFFLSRVSFWITESSSSSPRALSETCEETTLRTVFRVGSRRELCEVRGREGSWKVAAERQSCYSPCSWRWKMNSIFFLQKDRVANNVGKWHCLLTGPEAPPVSHWKGVSIHLTLYL